MFDKLVESAKQKQGGRARALFLATGMIYAVALFAFGVMAITGFSPALAVEYDLLTKLIPPPPLPGAPESLPKRSSLRPAPSPIFMEPKTFVDHPDLDPLKNWNPEPRALISSAPGWMGTVRDGAPGAAEPKEPPPPPPPTPTPVVKPVATPAQDSVVRLTSLLTQGRALRKVEPPYPTLARQGRVQGMVQVQIAISETGEVTDVTLLSGHPFLCDAAMRAAKQWLFKPTELNGRPVRAIGLITFNFKFD